MSAAPDYSATSPLGEICRARMKTSNTLASTRRGVGDAGLSAAVTQQVAGGKKRDGVFSTEVFVEISEDENEVFSESEGDLEIENLPRIETLDQAGGQQAAGVLSSSNLFVRLVNAMAEPRSIQAILAVSTLKSTDFTVLKTRQLFITAGGVPALLRLVTNMSLTPVDPEKRDGPDASRTDPKVAYEALFTLATLAEISSESRNAIIDNEGIKIGLSIMRANFSPAVTYAHGIRGRALRMVAGCCMKADCRLALRRIGGLAILARALKQATKDFPSVSTQDHNDYVYGIVSCIDALMHSARCREAFRAAGGVQLLVNSISVFPVQFPVSDAMYKLTADQQKAGTPTDFLYEAIAGALRTLSKSKAGRQDIHNFGGIPKVCALLQKTSSPTVRQRAVAILANCAQDSGVDSAVRKAGGLAVLSSLLNSQDTDTLISACKTIVLVSRKGPYFGSYQASMECESQNGYLGFNSRNDENILALCKHKAVAGLTSHIDVPLDLLCVGERPEESLVVTAGVGATKPDNPAAEDAKEETAVSNARDTRQLVLQATEALVPLLSCKDGRVALKGNKPLFNALIRHLSVADAEVLVATAFAIFTACENDPETAKLVGAAGAIPSLWSLLRHSNMLVVTAAARALNPLLRDKTRSFNIGRQINGAIDLLAVLLHNPAVLDDSTDGITDEGYKTFLTLECKGWLVGMVGELAQDVENARVLTEHHLLPVVCQLTRDFSCSESQCASPYEFYVRQLIKEKCSLALATMSSVDSNKNIVAELDTIPALVRFLCNREGLSIFDPSLYPATKVLGQQIARPDLPFGSLVNFKEKEATCESTTGVDREPSQTADPYIMVNRTAALAMAELSKNRKCAVLLRQCGAVYGLLTLIGSGDAASQSAAGRAISNIRRQHIGTLESFTKRAGAELETVQTQNTSGKVASVPVIQRAVEQLYEGVDSESQKPGASSFDGGPGLGMGPSSESEARLDSRMFSSSVAPARGISLSTGSGMSISILQRPRSKASAGSLVFGTTVESSVGRSAAEGRTEAEPQDGAPLSRQDLEPGEPGRGELSEDHGDATF